MVDSRGVRFGGRLIRVRFGRWLIRAAVTATVDSRGVRFGRWLIRAAVTATVDS